MSKRVTRWKIRWNLITNDTSFNEVKCTFILILFLIHQCNPDSFSVEDNYSEEVSDQWSPDKVFRLFINSNEESSYPLRTIEPNSSKSSLTVKDSIWHLHSNFTKLINSTTSMKESEKKSDPEWYDFDDNDFLKISSKSGELSLVVPTSRTSISPSRLADTFAIGSEGSHKVVSSLFKNAQREPLILPASDIIDESHEVKGYKPKRRKKLKYRKKHHQHEPQSTLIPPINSLNSPTPKPFLLSPDRFNPNNNNVSLKATFLTPKTEESSSIELKLSMNGNFLEENHQTKIQIANPERQCVQIVDSNRKRTTLNFWTYSDGKLKLESQREVPPSIFNGIKIVDGELLNRAEVPQPVSNLLRSILTEIGRSNNATMFNNINISGFSEKLFDRNRRRNVIMLHYILWGQREKVWRVMLDKTVERYLRNYFLSTYGTKRSSRVQKPTNWRKMRNVLLSFIASSDVNCTSSQTLSNTRINPERELSPNQYYHLKVPEKRRPALGMRPKYTRRQKPGSKIENINLPITRDESGGYGWQQNGGWGGVQQQGWGVPDAQQGWGSNQGYGWGWEGQGKKKNKKKKKKGKKKKKKKKKRKNLGNGWGWGDPPGWVATPVALGQSAPTTGWGPIQWNSFELDPGDIIHKSLAIIGLFGLPIGIFLGVCVFVYLLAQKHSGKQNHYIHSTYHQPPISPQIVYSSGFPEYGWRRRTERPNYYYGFDESASTHTPDFWIHPDYYIPPTNALNLLTNNKATTTSPTIKPNPNPPLTFADIKKSENFRYNEISETYPRIRNQGIPGYKDYDRKTSYHYDPYYNENYNSDMYYHHNSIPVRTKQDKDVIKILTRHKKDHLEKLLRKWKLSKIQNGWW